MAYCDPVAGAFGAFALLAALRCRARTGQGQYIDLAQMQAAASTLGYPLMEYIMNKRNLPCTGNRHRWAAPHGCYRCQGNDSWISIAVTTEEEWQALCAAMGNPAWSSDERFQDMQSRKRNEDELDGHIEEWTSKQEHYDAMFRLQEAGVSGIATLNSLEAMNDAHMVSRGNWVQTNYTPTGDDELIPGVHWKLSRSTGGFYRHAPLLGGDRDYVLGELLGIGRSEMAALEERGVFY
jgi:benzylsuccinate CoA-transferase BbsF subunit